MQFYQIIYRSQVKQQTRSVVIVRRRQESFVTGTMKWITIFKESCGGKNTTENPIQLDLPALRQIAPAVKLVNSVIYITTHIRFRCNKHEMCFPDPSCVNSNQFNPFRHRLIEKRSCTCTFFVIYFE